jgi:hypothetical protein
MINIWIAVKWQWLCTAISRKAQPGSTVCSWRAFRRAGLTGLPSGIQA